MEKVDPIRFDKEKMAKIVKKYHLVFVVLFGSKARGEKQNIESDLDIAVLPPEESSYELFKNLYSEFSDLFRGENVDVRFLDDSNLMFRYQVVKHGILLAGDEKEYLDYKLSIIRQYADDGKKYLPILDKLVHNRLEILEKKL